MPACRKKSTSEEYLQTYDNTFRNTHCKYFMFSNYVKSRPCIVSCIMNLCDFILFIYVMYLVLYFVVTDSFLET